MGILAAKATQQIQSAKAGKKDRPDPTPIDQTSSVLDVASPSVGPDFSRVPIHSARPRALQMKPASSQPGDEYEQEADSVAERVLSMTAPRQDSAHRQAAVSHTSESYPRLQTKSLRTGNAEHTTAPSIAHEVLHSPGLPLDSATRDFFEPRFGHDFSSVRVHVGTEPSRAAQAIEARAYTLGRDIVFGQGAYAPSTADGSRLLAHELTHVLQQRSGSAVIQRQEAAAAPASTEPETEGDKARKAILEAAEKRLKEKTTIVSEADIKDIREGRIRLRLVTLPDGSEVKMNIPTATPVKNFTTCIEFAGQTFGDASKVLGKNAKDSQRIAALLPGILKIFNQEFSLNAQIEAFQKAVMMFNKPIADVRKRQTSFDDKKQTLEGQKTGEKLHDKGIDQAIKGQDQAIRQLDSAIATMEREQKKFETKVKKLEGDYSVLDAQDDALVRATTPLTGRPKPGEYILLGAGAKQAYGVSTETKVSLAKGSFKHIAVFKSSEPAPSPKDKPAEKWEKWQTIDGGGIEAKATSIYVCLSDLRVQFANYDQPWAASNTSLIGWIDMDKLLAGNAGDKKDATAPPAR